MILDAHRLSMLREKLRRERARHADAVAVIGREIDECEAACRPECPHKYSFWHDLQQYCGDCGAKL